MFDLFVEFVIYFEIIAFTLRIYVSLVPFDFIIGFYCVIWHGFVKVMGAPKSLSIHFEGFVLHCK